MPSYSCPECGAAIKSANPIPAGKKVKCPKCATVFPIPAKDQAA
ncbi:MAG: phosphohydrolase, partial [Planctomycetes bacterium]|nr:phosphohydrolase [Planctomycetota bacterium]